MNVTLLNFTPEPEKTVSIAAKLCYSDLKIGELEEKVKAVSYEKFLGKIIKMGHLSILEHASFTFGIEGISRAASHQLVRHRIASYSQQSQRYVNAGRDKEYVIPPSIKDNKETLERFNDFISRLYGFYSEMLESAIPKEDARYILPNAACTKIIVTMNARELIHFFTLRCCARAQWEIRDMATKMLILAKKAAPVIFKTSGPACVNERCDQGDMTCGKANEVRKKFRNL